jgi:hemin uptake protein HemP
MLRGCRQALDVEVLFGGTRELRLIYHSEEYRLRITRNNKLILTK